MDQRDRDPAGRARNARPRDALGRPLPRDAAGVERVPDDLILPPGPALVEAQRLLDEGRPFHAHEILEGTWKAAPVTERQLWRALAQLCVGLTHRRRGNHAGAAALLVRAGDGLGDYAGSSPYDVDVDGLIALARRLADASRGARDGTTIDDDPPVRLRVS